MILLIEQGLYMVKVEIIYATLEQQNLIDLTVKEQSSIESCIQLSGLLEKYPEIDLAVFKVGIFSQVKPLSYEVNEGDRIEIYRPLIADPKVARRNKAEAAKNKLT